MNAIEKLVHRMRTFDGHYDGYPGMTETDPQLVSDAMLETKSDDATVLLAYVASEHVRDDASAYVNAMRFIAAHVDNAIVCNMVEGENPLFDGVKVTIA